MPANLPKRHSVVNLGCAVLLVALAWVDYVTGYEFGFFIFYFIPVSIAAWYVGRTSGLVFAVASAVAWYASDRLSHHPYSKVFFIYWETFMRLVSFLTTALTLQKIRSLTFEHRQLRDSLHEAHAENGELRRRLEDARAGPRDADDPGADA